MSDPAGHRDRLDRSGRPVATQPAPKTLPGRAIRRILWKKLHVPRGIVHAALTGAKTASVYRQVRRRRELAAGLPKPQFEIQESEGLSCFEAGKLPGTEQALAVCRERFAECADDARSFNPNKQEFLRTVISGDDFATEPELVRFMISRPILETVASYLGAAPVLAGATLWWSPPNTSATSSQLWHLDNEDRRQVKVFVNVNDVDEDQGPFTCLPADHSHAAARGLRQGRGRMRDEEVLGLAGCAPVQLIGPAGSGAFVDTARCLHFGSRGNRRERLVLMFQFLRLEAPTESTFRVGRFPALRNGLDEIQRLAISQG